ncbi:MAG: DUF302 domain-containing protein [Magnetococcales bacterium]|nr:DUF302 domain-containing protein [Magnetococcales bacterium]
MNRVSLAALVKPLLLRNRQCTPRPHGAFLVIALLFLGTVGISGSVGAESIAASNDESEEIHLGHAGPEEFERTEAEKQFDTIEGVRHHGPILQIPMPEGVTLEDLEMTLESEIAGANLKIVARQNIGKALRDRGDKDFPDYRIYHICNLTVGGKLLSLEPAFGAFMPCKLVLYEESPGGRVWALTYKPAFALAYFPEISQEAVDAAQDVGDRMYDILYLMATDG